VTSPRIVTRGADLLTETPARPCGASRDATAWHRRLHLAPEMNNPLPLLSRGRVLRDPRQPRHHLGDPMHREMLDLPAVVLIRGAETVGYQVPTDWRLASMGRQWTFIDGLLAGRQPAQDIRPRSNILQVAAGDLRGRAPPDARWRRSRSSRPSTLFRVAPRPAGPQPRDGLQREQRSESRLGRRGPSPATACSANSGGEHGDSTTRTGAGRPAGSRSTARRYIESGGRDGTHLGRASRRPAPDDDGPALGPVHATTAN